MHEACSCSPPQKPGAHVAADRLTTCHMAEVRVALVHTSAETGSLGQ